MKKSTLLSATCAMLSKYEKGTNLRTTNKSTAFVLRKFVHRSYFDGIITGVILFSFIGVINPDTLSGQNIGINPTGALPDASALLDVDAAPGNNKGLLIPRVALASSTTTVTIASPATSLLVYNDGTGGLTPAGYYYNAGNTTSPLWVQLLNGGTPGTAWTLTGNSGTTASTAAIGSTVNNNFIGTTDAKDFVFATNNLERLRIASGGNIGIGTTTPAYKLDILNNNSAGSGSAYRALNISQIRTEPTITANTTARGIYNSLLYRITEDLTTPYHGYGSAADNVVYTDGTNTFNWLQGANNIAYSNSTATSNQDDLAGALNQGYLNSSGTLTRAYGAYNMCINNGSGTIQNSYGSLNVAQNLSASASAAITSAIGSLNYVYNGSTAGGTITTGYGVYSYLNKAASASAIGTGYLFYGAYYNGAATTPYGLYLTGESNNYFSGNVGIGCTAPVYTLDVRGTLGVSGQITTASAVVTTGVAACSDIRYKKDITPLPDALSNIMKLQGVNYFWKTKEFPEKQFTGTKQLGFIAQELEKIYPEVVMTDKDGYKSVDYSRLTPVLVEAIKEQQKTIQSLQLAVGSLQTENKTLKAENDNLKAEVGSIKTNYDNRIKKLEEYLFITGKK